MNKTEFVEKIAAATELSKADSKKALEAVVATIKEALVAGEGPRERGNRCTAAARA